MPVKFGSSPALALAYRPFGSRRSHSSSGVDTHTSRKRRPARSWTARAAARSAAKGDTRETSATTPASASSAATSAVRRTFSARSAAEKPRSPLRPWRRLSPSSTYAARPAPSSRASTALASVDLPEAGRPVNQTVAPGCPSASQRWPRSSSRCCQTTSEERGGSAATVGGIGEHAGAHGLVGLLVDEDERAGLPVDGVRVVEQVGADAQRDRADLVAAERVRTRARLQRLHLQRVVDDLQARALGPRRVLDQVAAAEPARVLPQPADRRLDVAAAERQLVGTADQRAAAGIDLVLEADGDRERRRGGGDRAGGCLDGRHARGQPRREDEH